MPQTEQSLYEADSVMILKIDHLRDDHGTYEPFDFTFQPPQSDEDYVLLSPIKVSGTVVFGGNSFLLAGHISAQIEVPCGRCLVPVIQEMELDFDEEFEDDEIAGEDTVVDVGDIAAQVWEASIPMRVLCSEECKGFCPICGKNLNEGDCGCPLTEMDPRLEVLRSLIVDNE